MRVTVLYVGSSLLAPLRQAENEIEKSYALGLRVAAYNFGAPLDEGVWRAVERDVGESEVVFVLHVTDGENATRLLSLLKREEARRRTIVVINCMPELMRQTRMGRLKFGGEATPATTKGNEAESGIAKRLAHSVGAWMGEQVRGHRARRPPKHTQYLGLIERLPGLLRLMPSAGRLRDAKNYLYLFCYFLQPTPANIRSMLLYVLKHYSDDARVRAANLATPAPESMPAVAIYHPEAPALFETFDAYRKWHRRRGGLQSSITKLTPDRTIGLLLMRPQIVSGARGHYDGLIRAIEAEGLSVIPAISTFMDNREACEKFFVEVNGRGGKKVREAEGGSGEAQNELSERSRVSQIVSLTGFSFVGGPAMNDSEAAAEFLGGLNRPFRSVVSLDVQTVEAWQDSPTGLNPVQAGMQIAIPEIDGATEPFIYGGMTTGGAQPVALEERCLRIARRLRRWNNLQTAERASLKLAMLVFCFPPNKGNIGTAADLDGFPSVWETLRRLQQEGYTVEVPESPDELRALVLGGNSEKFGATANVAYRMGVEEYWRLCPYVEEIEKEWGAAPGAINSFGDSLLVQGVMLGNVFLGVQPTFGYEGDPMRMLMSRGSAPHHGFAAFYTYLEKVFKADAVVHVGTHGALEFMPGKQIGLSAECWPDRLIGELPHVYIYSVNNPSEGSIARRRSYAELISYLTPPVEDAGVYRDLASLKELLSAYRQSTDEREREELFGVIEEKAATLHFEGDRESRHVA